jgi:hypothetical protein
MQRALPGLPKADSPPTPANKTPTVRRPELVSLWDINLGAATSEQVLRSAECPAEEAHARAGKTDDTVEMSAKSKDPTVRMENPPPKTPGKVVPCPQCGAPLLDAGPHPWCGGCGYCGELEESAKRLIRKAAPRRVLSWKGVVLGALGVMAVLMTMERLLSFTPDAQYLGNVLPILLGVGGLVILVLAAYLAWPAPEQKKNAKETHQKMRRPLLPP